MRILPRSLAVALVVALGTPVLLMPAAAVASQPTAGVIGTAAGAAAGADTFVTAPVETGGVVAALRQQSGQQLTPATQFDGFAITTSDHSTGPGNGRLAGGVGGTVTCMWRPAIDSQHQDAEHNLGRPYEADLLRRRGVDFPDHPRGPDGADVLGALIGNPN